MTSGIRFQILGLFGLVALAAPVTAADFHVDGLNGSDANDGLSVATAKRTIQAGIDLAVTPGDIVSVLPGEYLENFVMGPSQNGVTLRALGEVVLISPAENQLTDVSDARIEGLTFRTGTDLLFTQVRLLSATNILFERCRFLENGLNGIDLGGSGTVFRECLFADLGARAINYGSSAPNTLVDRCTFARNDHALTRTSGVPALVRNSVLFENAIRSDTDGVYAHCAFFGEVAAPSPLGSNIIADPLFIDPDSRVYFVKAGSPLLDQGQDGGPIGAFGQGLHTSKDVSKDEPTQAGTAWGAWIDQNGDALSASSLVELNGQGEILLRAGVTSAAVYSPVFDTGSAFTVIRSVDFGAFEDTTLAAGSREIIDAVQGTPLREVRIRSHTDAEGTFSQDPGITPPVFVAVDKQVKFKQRARFVQMELVLRNDGD